MTELSYAKTFLNLLDSKPTKIPSSHVEDPKTYPARSAYILPKNPRPLTKKAKTIPGSEPSVTVVLKSIRNPPLDISLSSLPLSTSILSLKETLESQTSIPIPKIRLLYAKKPVPDSKILKDLLADGEEKSKLEFSVMVIGGAAAITKGKADEMEVEVEAAVPAAGISGKEVLETEEFWGDLKGFLVQRLKDEKEGERLWSLFKSTV